jgi:membrane-bound lytic murein transglycosylase D
MPASKRLARRGGAPALYALTFSATLLITAGCASDRSLSGTAGSDYDESVSAREYGYVRPAADIWVLEATQKSQRSKKGGDARLGGSDLWERVRTGM